MKEIKFVYSRGWNDIIEEIIEFEDDASDDGIEEAFGEWVWEQVGDQFSWEEVQ